MTVVRLIVIMGISMLVIGCLYIESESTAFWDFYFIIVFILTSTVPPPFLSLELIKKWADPPVEMSESPSVQFSCLTKRFLVMTTMRAPTGYQHYTSTIVTLGTNMSSITCLIDEYHSALNIKWMIMCMLQHILLGLKLSSFEKYHNVVPKQTFCI